MEGKKDPPVEPPGFDVTKKTPPALKDRAAKAEYFLLL